MAVGDAPWQRVRDDIADRIADGEWPVGEPIPSMTHLPRVLNASRSTIARAIRALQEAGVLQGRQGVGVTVVREPVVADLGDLTLAERVAALERRLDEHERDHP